MVAKAQEFTISKTDLTELMSLASLGGRISITKFDRIEWLGEEAWVSVVGTEDGTTMQVIRAKKVEFATELVVDIPWVQTCLKQLGKDVNIRVTPKRITLKSEMFQSPSSKYTGKIPEPIAKAESLVKEPCPSAFTLDMKELAKIKRAASDLSVTKFNFEFDPATPDRIFVTLGDITQINLVQPMRFTIIPTKMENFDMYKAKTEGAVAASIPEAISTLTGEVTIHMFFGSNVAFPVVIHRDTEVAESWTIIAPICKDSEV